MTASTVLHWFVSESLWSIFSRAFSSLLQPRGPMFPLFGAIISIYPLSSIFIRLDTNPPELRQIYPWGKAEKLKMFQIDRVILQSLFPKSGETQPTIITTFRVR
jgi:hypothetical protein